MSAGIRSLNFSSGFTGTKQTSTSASTIPYVPDSSASHSHLGLLAAYVVGADCTLAQDAGEGWVVLAAGYDGTYGALLAACIMTHPGSVGPFLGLNLPANAAFTSQSAWMRFAEAGQSSQIGGMERHSFVGAWGSSNSDYFSDASSGTTLTFPRRSMGYAQTMDLVVVGYTNNGADPVETITPPGGWTEIIDVGQNSPAHGLGLYVFSATTGDGTGTQGGTVRNLRTDVSGANSATISSASTNRVAIRATIPVHGNVMASAMRNRFMSSRRFG